MKKSTFSGLALFLLLPLFLTAQTSTEAWIDRFDGFLKKHVRDGRVDYEKVKDSPTLTGLQEALRDIKVDDTFDNKNKAFYINAYNLLVIYAVAQEYPVNSVQEVSSFFDRKNYTIAGQKYSLNGLEKDFIFKKFPDPRLHFVLVCGAIDCPPITNFAYRAEALDAQLDTQTKASLNNPNFIKEENGKIGISNIFKWYNNDFGGSTRKAITYINTYREAAISPSANTYFYDYNWGLNDVKTAGAAGGVAANAFRYVTSAAIPKGQTELKVFNNLYSQKTGDGNDLNSRSTFFTSSISALYGINNRFNAGLEIRYRRTLNSGIPSSALDAFGNLDGLNGRQGITGIGPRIRWAPIPKWSGFSLQSTFTFPIGSELSGGNGKPFIEFDGPIFWTQFYYDQSIGSRYSIFLELDLLFEDLGKGNSFSTPATVIFSYFPTTKWTLYGLAGYSPRIQSPFDYFHQAGLGTKYQITRKFEIELLYTSFRNKFIKSVDGVANTFNLGVRFTL